MLRFILAAAFSTVSTSAEIPAMGPQVRVEGRFAATAGGGVRLGFPGVTLHLRCRAKSLLMRVDASSDDVYFDVAVDGGEAGRLRALTGTADYPLLPAGASEGEHTVEVVRRSESWQGTCEVVGFDAGPGGEFLAPPAARPRRLLFIGDSVTCGELSGLREDDPLGPGAKTRAYASNARLSYGYLLARRLGAEVSLVSYGGRGVFRDWQGIRNTANAPQFYERALPDDPASAWNHAAYVPDAIGIALGTNDFSQGVPDENEFVNTYVELIRKVRRDAPGAWIWLIGSPILEDKPGAAPKRSVLEGYLREVVGRVGDPRCAFAPVRHYPGVPHNGHPTGADHAAIADELEPVVREALRW
jgi:lysophospholipase L1-like esterase